MSREDAQEIADRLNDDIEGVISQYWPGWIRSREKGVDIALLTPRQKDRSKKPTSSFKVELSGRHRGRWYRFSQGVGGYGLALMFYGHSGRVPDSKDDYREAFRLAREYLGIVQQRQESPEDTAERDAHRRREQEARDAVARREAEERARKDAARVLTAQDVWSETVPLAGTQGEAYLVARGIPPIPEWPWSPDQTIRFHPSLRFEPDRDAGRFPAVVARVEDVFGSTVAVWQIFLDRQKPVKADLDPSPKIGLGPAKGGAVRIGGEGPWIGGAEGLESALGAWALEGYRRPVWSFLSTSGMASFEPPVFVERMTIWPDGDKAVMSPTGMILDPPGIKAARELHGRLKAVGIRCAINETVGLGDALDLLVTRRKFEARWRDHGAQAAASA